MASSEDPSKRGAPREIFKQTKTSMGRMPATARDPIADSHPAPKEPTGPPKNTDPPHIRKMKERLEAQAADADADGASTQQSPPSPPQDTRQQPSGATAGQQPGSPAVEITEKTAQPASPAASEIEQHSPATGKIEQTISRAADDTEQASSAADIAEQPSSATEDPEPPVHAGDAAQWPTSRRQPWW